MEDLVLISPPAVEPISVTDVQNQARLSDAQITEEGNYITTLLIPRARHKIEGHLRRALITQTWLYKRDGFPGPHPSYESHGYPEIRIPKPPFQSLILFQYVDVAGVLQTLTPADPISGEVSATPPSFPVLGVNQVGGTGQNYFLIAAKQAPYFPPGGIFGVTAATGNNGTYTVVSAAPLLAGSPLASYTQIIVAQVIPSGVADGAATPQGPIPPFYGYQIDPGGEIEPARLLPPWERPWPPGRLKPNNVLIQFVAGFGDNPTDVPPSIRGAILLQAAFMYENRETGELAKGVEDMINEWVNRVA